MQTKSFMSNILLVAGGLLNEM